jgi:hypothetical protein
VSVLTTFSSGKFNANFLGFRIRYYFHVTREALLRHKLILIFLFCLLTPGLDKIKMIGVPFSIVLNPGSSFIIKCFSILSILVFLSILVKSQIGSIRGGELRNYLVTLPISSAVNKKIDLIILMISLNIVWLAFFFGATDICLISSDNTLSYSYYVLYLAFIVTTIVFLLNLLYENIRNMLVLSVLLMLVARASISQSWILNIGLALFSILVSVIIVSKVHPSKQKRKFAWDNKIKVNERIINYPKRLNYCILLASVRSCKMAFIAKTSLCFVLTIALVAVVFYAITDEGLLLGSLILMGAQSYILSTLATIFSKNEIKYNIFHSIFQYNFFANRGIETLFIILLFILSLSPLVVFAFFVRPDYLLLILSIMAVNSVMIAINRLLYVFSFRFCFFTSMIGSAISIALQFMLIGVCFGK